MGATNKVFFELYRLCRKWFVWNM